MQVSCWEKTRLYFESDHLCHILGKSKFRGCLVTQWGDPIFHTENAPQNERQCVHLHVYLELGVTSFTYSFIPRQTICCLSMGTILLIIRNLWKNKQFQPFSGMDKYVLEERYMLLAWVIEELLKRVILFYAHWQTEGQLITWLCACMREVINKVL